MRILIIDEDPLIRAGCCNILGRRGFACTAVEDGRRAIECIRRASFDAALLDFKTPVLPGMETLKKLRDESPNTAIIVITGCASIDSAVAAVRAGAFDYLPKPFTPEVLAARVRRAARAVRENMEESLIRQEVERKKLGHSSGSVSVLPAAIGRVARLIHGSTADSWRDGKNGKDNSLPNLARLEADAIQNALRRFNGNKTRAAGSLGINRKTLREKMRRYGISET